MDGETVQGEITPEKKGDFWVTQDLASALEI